jgi:hypothetical protein
MIIYSSDGAKQKWPKTDPHDPNSVKNYPIYYRPPVRENSKEYIKDVDVITLPTANGCMYECVSGGVSASNPPTFSTLDGATISDGTVIWKCKPIRSRLAFGDTLLTSTWAANHADITLSDEVMFNNDTATAVLVSTVPATLTAFELTNTIEIERVNGRNETFDKTLIITVKQL